MTHETTWRFVAIAASAFAVLAIAALIGTFVIAYATVLEAVR